MAEALTERSYLLTDCSSHPVKLEDPEKNIYIMTAGKTGSGKSTSLNNIFGLSLQADISPHSVTKDINISTTSKHGVNVRVIDTPGFGARDINKEEVSDMMCDIIQHKKYTLLYCLSVAPCSRLTEEDEAIVGNLHKVLGKEVWEKCVLLFTFSDTAWRESFADTNDISGYKKHIEVMAAGFADILKKLDACSPSVHSVFEPRTDNGVLAIPIGKKLTSTTEILPGIPVGEGKNWTDLVFVEILRRTAKDKRTSLLKLKYGSAVAGSTAVTTLIGVLVGTGVGVTVGVFGGPIGIIVAGGLGAAVGASVGGATGLISSSVLAAARWKRKVQAKKKLLKKDPSHTEV